ncbi:hypothetical protein J2S81_004573 [Pseudomonas otitidis]|nr:hypothetical protein [Pseudomonas otitidis]
MSPPPAQSLGNVPFSTQWWKDDHGQSTTRAT